MTRPDSIDPLPVAVATLSLAALAAVLLLLHIVWSRRMDRTAARKGQAVRAELAAAIASPAAPLVEFERLPPHLLLPLLSDLAGTLHEDTREQLFQRLHTTRLVQRQTRRLRSRRWEARLIAARALTMMSVPVVLDPLFDDRHPLVRMAAAEWAAANPNPQRISRMFALLEDRRMLGRFAVEQALSRTGPALASPLRSFLDTAAGDALLSGLRIASTCTSPEVEPALLRHSASPELRIRRQCALALAQIHSADSTAALARLLADNEDSVRIAAAESLGSRRDAASLAALAQALADVNFDVRRAAAQALLLFGAPGRVLLRSRLPLHLRSDVEILPVMAAARQENPAAAGVHAPA